MADVLNAKLDLVLGGVSETEVSGLVVKIVALTGPDIQAMLTQLWQIIWSTLWVISLPELRIT